MNKFIEYPKINTIFKRDMTTHKLIYGQFSQPEFEKGKDQFAFYIFCTGNLIDIELYNLFFVTTIQCDGLVYHIFVDPKNR